MSADGRSGEQAIDALLASLDGWRGATLARFRALIREAVPSVIETVKWRKPTNPAGAPVWEAPGGGILCTGGAFRDKVKLTFARGASLPDPQRVFNASLHASTCRAIDLREGEQVDAEAFKALVRAAADATRGTR